MWVLGTVSLPLTHPGPDFSSNLNSQLLPSYLLNSQQLGSGAPVRGTVCFHPGWTPWKPERVKPPNQLVSISPPLQAITSEADAGEREAGGRRRQRAALRLSRGRLLVRAPLPATPRYAGCGCVGPGGPQGWSPVMCVYLMCGAVCVCVCVSSLCESLPSAVAKTSVEKGRVWVLEESSFFF